MHARTRAGLVALALFTTLTLSAQAKPNFSGEWTLVVDKSEFGPMPKPDKLDRTVTHQEPVLKFVTVQSGAQGAVTTESTYATDGTISKNTVNGNSMTTTAKWEGATLVLTSLLNIQGTDIPVVDKLDLSADGKTMTQVRTLDTPDGAFTVTLVLAKQ